MKEKLFGVVCQLAGIITWGILLLTVIVAAIPMMILDLLVDTLKGNE